MSSLSVKFKDRIASRINTESKKRGLKPEHFIEMLLDVYDLKEIDLLIQQIRRKSINYEFDSIDRAKLSMLQVLLDNVL